VPAIVGLMRLAVTPVVVGTAAALAAMLTCRETNFWRAR
jgi:hypothetical protein